MNKVRMASAALSGVASDTALPTISEILWPCTRIPEPCEVDSFVWGLLPGHARPKGEFWRVMGQSYRSTGWRQASGLRVKKHSWLAPDRRFVGCPEAVLGARGRGPACSAWEFPGGKVGWRIAFAGTTRELVKSSRHARIGPIADTTDEDAYSIDAYLAP